MIALGNAQDTRNDDVRGLKARHIWPAPASKAAWGGLSALNKIDLIATQGDALGWHIAGPLALKNARPFSGIAGHFPINSKPGSGSVMSGKLSLLERGQAEHFWQGLAGAPSKEFGSAMGDQNRVLEVGGWLAVIGDDGPTIG